MEDFLWVLALVGMPILLGAVIAFVMQLRTKLTQRPMGNRVIRRNQ
jgi:hypothetical protein